MHGFTYDEIHDEFTITQEFSQAILTFAGGADGETAPLRVIQGSKTRLVAPDRVAVDAAGVPLESGDQVDAGVARSHRRRRRQMMQRQPRLWPLGLRPRRFLRAMTCSFQLLPIT